MYPFDGALSSAGITFVRERCTPTELESERVPLLIARMMLLPSKVRGWRRECAYAVIGKFFSLADLFKGSEASRSFLLVRSLHRNSKFRCCFEVLRYSYWPQTADDVESRAERKTAFSCEQWELVGRWWNRTFLSCTIPESAGRK